MALAVNREAARMLDVEELLRLPSPAPRPQSLAFDGTRLWMGSIVTDRLYSIDDDNRIIRRFVPGHGFKTQDSVACPDDTGSQLSFDGERLYVSQWYRKRILSLDDAGKVGSTIPVPHGICGQVVVGGRFYCVTTDDEETDEYFLTCVDARGEMPVSSDVARVGFPARALAFDGERFWTNHREADQIVAFRIERMPDHV